MSKDSTLTDKLNVPPLFQDSDLITMAPIRLKAADLARLLGVSRARISQLTTAGRIKRFSDGTFDPNAVARQLIATENPKVARSKILFQLREEIHDARRLATEAQQSRDAALRLHAGLLEAFREVITELCRCEMWLNGLYTLLEAGCADGAGIDAAALEAAWDASADASFKAGPDDLVRGPNPDDLRLLLLHDPESPLALALAAHHPPPAAPAPDTAAIGELTDEELAELLAMDPFSAVDEGP